MAPALAPSSFTWEGLQNVVRYTVNDDEKDKLKGVEKYSVWSSDFVERLRWVVGQHQNVKRVELAVVDIIPTEEYCKIVDIAREAGFVIINPREHPYYPQAVWLAVSCLDQVLSFKPQFEGQIILIMVDHTVPSEDYAVILFEAVVRGYVVLNGGPWRENDLIPEDDSKFEAELHEKKNHLIDEVRIREDAELSLKQMRYMLKKKLNVAWLASEAIGRDQACAEMLAVREATIKSLDEEIACLRDNLGHYKTLIPEMVKNYQEDMRTFVKESHFMRIKHIEEAEKMAKAEVAFRNLCERFGEKELDLYYEMGVVREAVVKCSWEETEELLDKLQWH